MPFCSSPDFCETFRFILTLTFFFVKEEKGSRPGQGCTFSSLSFYSIAVRILREAPFLCNENSCGVSAAKSRVSYASAPASAMFCVFPLCGQAAGMCPQAVRQYLRTFVRHLAYFFGKRNRAAKCLRRLLQRFFIADGVEFFAARFYCDFVKKYALVPLGSSPYCLSPDGHIRPLARTAERHKIRCLDSDA